MKRTVFIVGCLTFAAIILLLLIPTIVAGFESGFRWRSMSSELSPDGRFRIVITKRIAFPANEWVDPSAVVRAELSDVATGRVIAAGRVVLIEDSDYSTPAVQWHASEVRVTGFDRRQNQTVTLRHQPDKPLQPTAAAHGISFVLASTHHWLQPRRVPAAVAELELLVQHIRVY